MNGWFLKSYSIKAFNLEKQLNTGLYIRKHSRIFGKNYDSEPTFSNQQRLERINNPNGIFSSGIYFL
jgi:hypothetical protein